MIRPASGGCREMCAMSEKAASDVEACTCSRSSRRCRCPVSAAHRGCEELPSAGFRGSSCESDRGRPSPRWGGRDSHAQKSRSAAVSPGRFTERCTAAEWVVLQLRETFPEAGPYRYVILDRDSKFDADVITFLKATGLTPRRTSIQSPWQKDYASHCTSWVRGDTISLARRLRDSFTPWAFRGGLSPGCS